MFGSMPEVVQQAETAYLTLFWAVSWLFFYK